MALVTISLEDSADPTQLTIFVDIDHGTSKRKRTVQNC